MFVYLVVVSVTVYILQKCTVCDNLVTQLFGFPKPCLHIYILCKYYLRTKKNFNLIVQRINCVECYFAFLNKQLCLPYKSINSNVIKCGIVKFIFDYKIWLSMTHFVYFLENSNEKKNNIWHVRCAVRSVVIKYSKKHLSMTSKINSRVLANLLFF